MSIMKKFLNLILVFFFVAALSACNEKMHEPVSYDNETIVLDISSPGTLTKAAGDQIADNDVEARVDQIDVLIFNYASSAPGTLVYHERVNYTNSEVILNAKRSSFAANAGYYVQVIANSKLSADVFANLADYDALRRLEQSDALVHITGTTIQNAPVAFLMDGVAYTSASEPSAPAAVVLNNGVTADSTQLFVTLRRAAAKINLILKQGADVEFLPSTNAGYYVRNMRYNTSLVNKGLVGDEDLTTTALTAGAYFNTSTTGQVNVIAYSYEYDWASSTSFEDETCVIINLPVKYNGVDYPHNYYKVMVSKNSILERNHIYNVTATINAPGAENNDTPLELDTKYAVEPWGTRTIDVGSANKPKYLYVNEELVRMHNIARDSETLLFSSSSDVKITVNEVYYYDKFSVKRNVNVATSGVSVTADPGMEGNITIYSPVPVNNAIRYIRFTVTNQDTTISKEVIVEQYPLIYITNTQAWYSYRDDMGGTTYESFGNAGMVGAYWDGDSWVFQQIRQQKSNYGGSTTAHFASKVASLKNDNSGTSTISYYQYYYYQSNWSNSLTKSDKVRTTTVSNLNNARMYHVHVSASSQTYNVGYPARNPSTDYTLGTEDNKLLVSPSFEIASQLGATQVFSNNTAAAEHCARYVEVYKDPVTGATKRYDDWRLPTESEIKIIISLQYVDESPVDVVLSGGYYWSASGRVRNSQESDDGYGTSSANIRCIRDSK